MELQLIDTLKLYFPAALKLFCDITNQISLAFLSQYPTPEKAKKLTLKRFQFFLKKHKYTQPQRAEEIFSILQQDYPIAPEIFVQAKERFVKAIIPQILVILQQLDDYDREIKKHYDLHPDKNIFHMLPGVGNDIGPRLLSCFGDRRERFTHFNNIQCLAGTAPVTRKSGRSCHVFFRFSCNKIFRDVVDQMAFTSLQRSLWAKRYYDKSTTTLKKGGLKGDPKRVKLVPQFELFHSFILLKLPSYIFSNSLLIKTNCTHTVPLSPKMPTPVSLLQFQMRVKYLDGTFTLQETHHLRN